MTPISHLQHLPAPLKPRVGLIPGVFTFLDVRLNTSLHQTLERQTTGCCVMLYLEPADASVFDGQPHGVGHQLGCPLSKQDVVDQHPDGRHHGGRHLKAQAMFVVSVGENLLAAEIHHLPFRDHLRERGTML